MESNLDETSPFRMSRPSVKMLQGKLNEICRRAQREVESQPLDTQKRLTQQSWRVFVRYKRFGTGSALRGLVTRYLEGASPDFSHRLSISPTLEKDLVALRFNPTDSRMVDEESRELVRGMPFMIDRKLHIRPDVVLPADLFDRLERIFRVYHFQGAKMLRHHCEKYGDEPIFRVGIRSLLMSRSDTLLEAPRSHELGMMPQIRLFLLQVYERHPDVNTSEKQMLSRATGVGVATIELFWKAQTSRRAAYFAMRTVVAARELRRRRNLEAMERERQRKKEEAIQTGLWRGFEAEKRQRERRLPPPGIARVISASESATKSAAVRKRYASERTFHAGSNIVDSNSSQEDDKNDNNPNLDHNTHRIENGDRGDHAEAEKDRNQPSSTTEQGQHSPQDNLTRLFQKGTSRRSTDTLRRMSTLRKMTQIARRRRVGEQHAMHSDE